MDKDTLTIFALYGAMGVQLALAVIAGLLGGAWLDRQWGTTPWIALVGLTLGAIAGLWSLIRVLNWKTRSTDRSGS